MKEHQKMEKDFVFSLADDTAQIDAICFSRRKFKFWFKKREGV